MDLLKLPGVNAVGIGGKETKGRPTGQLVIKVFVEKKRAETELEPHTVIPRMINGIPTDVVERAPYMETQFDQSGRRYESETQIKRQPDTKRYRPLLGGCQLSARGASGDGTVGLLAKATVSGKQKTVVGTAGHVLGQLIHKLPGPGGQIIVTEGMKADQPKYGDSCSGCCTNRLGSYIKDSVLYHKTADAGLIALEGGFKYLAQIIGIGVVKGVHEITDAEARSNSYQVRKYGRTTQLTGGTVQGIEVEGKLLLRDYTNGIDIKANRDTSDANASVVFSWAGDSGAAVLNGNNEVVGLHFAGTKDLSHSHFGWGTATPIEDIIKSYASKGIVLSIETATQTNDIRTVPQTATASSRL